MDKQDWDEITAIGTAIASGFTAVLAFVTAAMAWYTRKAIKVGQAQRAEANVHFALTRDQDKQHHENSFRPLLVLTPSKPEDAFNRQAIVAITHAPRLLAVIVNCALCNIGSGPALNIHLSVRSDGRTDFGPKRELAPVAASDKFTDGDDQIIMLVIDTPSFNRADLENLPNGLWLLVLEYEDVFGNTFHTIHSKHLGEPWTRVGRGSAPDLTPMLPDFAEHAATLPRD